MAQIIELQNTIDQLAQTIDAEAELLFHFLGIIQKTLAKLRSLVAAVEDEVTLLWIFGHDDLGLRHCFTPLKGYLELIDHELVGTLTPQQKDRVSQALQCLNPIVQGVISCFTQGQHSYRAESIAPSIVIPVHQALNALCPILKYYLHNTGHLNISLPSDLQRIVYHRWYTPFLVVELISALKGEPDTDEHSRAIRLDIASSEEALIISIRAQNLLMLPRLWDQIRNRASTESLHELGGSIEPLTWDEGDGQGVIVRLPWANTQGA